MKATQNYSQPAMWEIQEAYRGGTGRHWFDTDSMRFFRTRLPSYGYKLDEHGYYLFISSEKGPHTERRYNVRALREGDVNTVGEFNEMTKSQALTLVKRVLTISPAWDGLKEF